MAAMVMIRRFTPSQKAIVSPTGTPVFAPGVGRVVLDVGRAPGLGRVAVLVGAPTVGHVGIEDSAHVVAGDPAGRTGNTVTGLAG